MVGEVFYWILNMSIIGSVMGCILLILRKIKKLPRFGIYLLWAVPFIRLWIPFGIANKYSLLNLLSRFTTRTIIVFEDASHLPDLTMTNSLMAADSYFPLTYKTAELYTVFSVWAAVWIIIFAAAMITACLLYGFTKSEIKNAEHLRENIYQSDRFTAPAVYGIFHPKIILPAGIPETDLPYILLHERVHVKRCDNLLRVAAVVTACLHWFNPLVWIFLNCFFEDMEFACDAEVLKECSESKRKDYALVLLHQASARKTMFASAFGNAGIKTRIEKILSYKRLTVVSFLCCSALIAAIAIVLLTNAAT